MRFVDHDLDVTNLNNLKIKCIMQRWARVSGNAFVSSVSCPCLRAAV